MQEVLCSILNVMHIQQFALIAFILVYTSMYNVYLSTYFYDMFQDCTFMYLVCTSSENLN